MPSRQPSRSTRALAAQAHESPPDRPSRRQWPQALRLALIPFVGLLVVAYLALLAFSLFAPQLFGLAPPANGASWPDALAYPLSVASDSAPTTLYPIIGGALIVMYGACALGARLFERPARLAVAVAPAPVPPAPSLSTPMLPTVPAILPADEPADEPAAEPAPVAPDDAAAASSLAASAPTLHPAAPTPERSVFVSHASGDNAFGDTLIKGLRAELGGRDAVWYDSRGGPGADGEWEGGIPPASAFQDEIVQELRAREVFVVILTERAMQSKWVHDEIALAWSQKNSADVTRGKVIVPVLREKCKVPPLVSLVQYVDFRPEVDQAKAFADLLYAIRLGQTRPAPPIELGPPFDLGLLPPLERFVGRAADVQRVMNLLTGESGSDGQIASVAAANGLGGIGKTALATEVVRRLMATTTFPDGIAVVICKGLTDPVEILRSVLARFTPDRRLPDDDTIPVLADRARQLLGGKQALVVLDNIEQGWPVHKVIQPLRAAGAAVLLTSRAELAAAVPREASVKLEVLPRSEALDVFAEYYGRGNALDLTRSELTAATTIVESLGRHTLAVKLAAANAAALGRPLDTVARELEQNPRRALLLENSDEAVRFVLESSYKALSPGAQQLFVALAAFATSDVGRRAALGVAGALRQETLNEGEQQAEAEAERALGEVIALRLADVALDERIPAEADRERLRLHPLVRTFAEGLLEKQDETLREETGRVVAEWYAYYTNATPGLALAPDEANIVGTIEWAQAQGKDLLLARLCIGIAGFWASIGRTFTALRYLPEGIAAAQRVAAASAQSDDKRQLARLQNSYGIVLVTAGRLDEAQRYLDESLQIRREVGDRAGEGTTLNNLSQVAQDRGRLDEAQRYLDESLLIAREVGNRAGEGLALGNLAGIARDRGRLDEAQRYLDESLLITREVGDRAGEGTTLNNLSQVAQARGRLDEAQRYLEASLLILREVGDRAGEGTALNNLAAVAQARGRLDEAQRYLDESLLITREVGDRAGEGRTLNNLASIAQERGHLAEAQRLYEEALAIARETQYAELEEAARGNLEAVIEARRAAGEL